MVLAVRVKARAKEDLAAAVVVGLEDVVALEDR